MVAKKGRCAALGVKEGFACCSAQRVAGGGSRALWNIFYLDDGYEFWMIVLNCS